MLGDVDNLFIGFIYLGNLPGDVLDELVGFAYLGAHGVVGFANLFIEGFGQFTQLALDQQETIIGPVSSFKSQRQPDDQSAYQYTYYGFQHFFSR